MAEIHDLFKQWCKETHRNGGVLVGKSVREFFDYYLEKRTENDSKTNEEDSKRTSEEHKP